MIEALQELDSIKLNFSPESLFTLNITLGLIMYGVALEIKIDDFKNIVKNPRSTIIGFISQFVLLPLMTFLLVSALNQKIPTSVALGMILVASCPGGNISNFLSSLAKGNIALSVSLTAIATLCAIFLTPFNFAFWGGTYIKLISHVEGQHLLRPLEINSQQMFLAVFILLGIPLILGMITNKYLPKFTSKITKPFKKLSIVLFIVIVLMAFKNNFDFFIEHIKYIFIIVLLHNIVSLATGYIFAKVLNTSVRDRRSITIETGIQNSGLALVLIFNPKIFPGDLEVGGMAFIAAWWGIWHIIAGLTIAGLWSKKQPQPQEATV